MTYSEGIPYGSISRRKRNRKKECKEKLIEVKPKVNKIKFYTADEIKGLKKLADENKNKIDRVYNKTVGSMIEMLKVTNAPAFTLLGTKLTKNDKVKKAVKRLINNNCTIGGLLKIYEEEFKRHISNVREELENTKNIYDMVFSVAKCPKCKSEIEDNEAVFCRKCGEPLKKKITSVGCADTEYKRNADVVAKYKYCRDCIHWNEKCNMYDEPCLQQDGYHCHHKKTVDKAKAEYITKALLTKRNIAVVSKNCGNCSESREIKDIDKNKYVMCKIHGHIKAVKEFCQAYKKK